MQCTLLKFMIYVFSVLLFTVSSGEYSYADDQKNTADTADNLEATIQKQEETIKQLQAEIKKQQEEIDKLKEKIPPPPHPVAQALRESWVGCKTRKVEVKDGLVRIYFIDIHDIIAFFDEGAELNGNRDLTVFLKAANLEKGTIEYYNGTMLTYSLTGSLADTRTKKNK